MVFIQYSPKLCSARKCGIHLACVTTKTKIRRLNIKIQLVLHTEDDTLISGKPNGECSVGKLQETHSKNLLYICRVSSRKAGGTYAIIRRNDSNGYCFEER
jgi:hypothetical protein